MELREVGDRFAVGHVGSIRASVNRAGRNPFPFAAEYEYSQSVVTDGELVFAAGQGGFGEDGAVVDPTTPRPRSGRRSPTSTPCSEAEGASLATVVKMTVYLARASDYDAFKRARHDALLAALSGIDRDRRGRVPVRRDARRDRRRRPRGRGARVSADAGLHLDRHRGHGGHRRLGPGARPERRVRDGPPAPARRGERRDRRRGRRRRDRVPRERRALDDAEHASGRAPRRGVVPVGQAQAALHDGGPRRRLRRRLHGEPTTARSATSGRSSRTPTTPARSGRSSSTGS